ncbi:uncharacterized protein LOC133890517 [Phragmites australis]|uniref:uncharacterized protein LOC133890517 n=1 Tax=Phragmites australis TaxID=29695 RepID=UPI002D785510|nr:uncharacterized protein LOC133890517 [Phragmites australis]
MLLSGLMLCLCPSLHQPSSPSPARQPPIRYPPTSLIACSRACTTAKQCHAADIPAVLARAWAAGVDRIIVTGGSLKESREALEIAETDGRLFCTVGVHPTRCGEFEESGDSEGHFQALLALSKEGIYKGKVVAVGECGLDYDRLHFCPADVHKKYFEKQFELAEAAKLPMFLHMRAADEDFCEIMPRNMYRQVLVVVAGCKGIAGIEGLSKTLYHNTCRVFFPNDIDASADAQLESGTAVQES